MYAEFAVMFMTLKSEIPNTALLRELLSSSSPTIGAAPTAESVKMTFQRCDNAI